MLYINEHMSDLTSNNSASDTNSSTAVTSTTYKRGKLRWTTQVENILAGWADKAIVYKWFHMHSANKYKKLNYGFSIPCVILSTILASATFSISGDGGPIPDQYKDYATYTIGGLNIFVGILQTLQNLFKYAQNSEAHDSVSKQWYKLYRVINTEINLERNKRRDADEFLKYCRAEFDRLVEQSPNIPKHIVLEFKQKFKNTADLDLPDICDVIEHTRTYPKDDIEPVAESVKKDDDIESIIHKINNNITTANMLMGRSAGLYNPMSSSYTNPVASDEDDGGGADLPRKDATLNDETSPAIV